MICFVFVKSRNLHHYFDILHEERGMRYDECLTLAGVFWRHTSANCLQSYSIHATLGAARDAYLDRTLARLWVQSNHDIILSQTFLSLTNLYSSLCSYNEWHVEFVMQCNLSEITSKYRDQSIRWNDCLNGKVFSCDRLENLILRQWLQSSVAVIWNIVMELFLLFRLGLLSTFAIID